MMADNTNGQSQGQEAPGDTHARPMSQVLITQEQASTTFAVGTRLSKAAQLTVAHHQALLPLLLRLSTTQTPAVDITCGH